MTPLGRVLGGAALAAALALDAGPAVAAPAARIMDFAELAGWAEDDLGPAFDAFLTTCADIRAPEWAPVCALAATRPNPRTFFELLFRPVILAEGQPALFTGYFEPELRGALAPTGPYRYPIYGRPPELAGGEPWLTRQDIEAGALEGRGLEIAWVDDPVDVFFLQVQGSGRIRLPGGQVLRVGYAAANGHEYRSVGRELVRRGIFTEHQVSAQVIRNWVRRNPLEGRELLHHNPSYVFFRKLPDLAPELGPLGAMNRPIRAGRSVAVDPRFVPLGAPVWIEKAGAEPMRRLMVAQDTGGAIKGPQRADIF
jgi:membrane-bound lytic murein transglycosylase A